MDFQKVEDFIRIHWPAAFMVAVIITPSVWGVAYLYFSQRIIFFNEQIVVLQLQQKELTAKVNTLEELAKRSKEKLEPSTSGFTADELFTPSPQLQP